MSYKRQIAEGTATLNYIIQYTTRDYIEKLDKKNPPEPSQIELELLKDIRRNIDMINAEVSKEKKLPVPKSLNHAQIAEIIAAIHPVARIVVSENEDDETANLLAVYQEDGDYKGTYRFTTSDLRAIAREYKYDLTSREFEEVVNALTDIAPRKWRTTDPDLIAVNNGIFNYKTKELLPFSKDYVYLSKSSVNYNPDATNPILHNDDDGLDWDVDSWIADLTDDPQIEKSIWEILSAVVRPHVRWDKAAWLYSTLGSNGKGTLVTLMRNLVGKKAYTSIPISQFAEPFGLEGLLNATAVIVDENDVGTYIDKAADLKAVVTNDVISVNRKHKSMVTYQFYGFMVQCLNEFPKVRDRSNSFNRRQLFIPMDKSFEGVERKYIKNDYLNRTDVLEYVLKKVLNTDFYILSTPNVSQEVLEEFKSVNDPVYQFATSIFPQLSWDVVPTDFLYDLYRIWYKRDVSEKGDPIGKIKFKKELQTIIHQRFKDDWEYNALQVRLKPTDTPSGEPLIMLYSLNDWYNKDYSGTDPDRLTKPDLTGKRFTGSFKRKKVHS